MKKRKMSLGSMKPQIRLRRNRSNSSVDIEEKIKSLKKSRSPLKGLLSGYKNVINHFYPKFDHQMQKIIDFYKEDSLSSKNDL
jgi:hypothetical protein